MAEDGSHADRAGLGTYAGQAHAAHAATLVRHGARRALGGVVHGVLATGRLHHAHLVGLGGIRVPARIGVSAPARQLRGSIISPLHPHAPRLPRRGGIPREHPPANPRATGGLLCATQSPLPPRALQNRTRTHAAAGLDRTLKRPHGRTPRRHTLWGGQMHVDPHLLTPQRHADNAQAPPVTPRRVIGRPQPHSGCGASLERRRTIDSASVYTARRPPTCTPPLYSHAPPAVWAWRNPNPPSRMPLRRCAGRARCALHGRRKHNRTPRSHPRAAPAPSVRDLPGFAHGGAPNPGAETLRWPARPPPGHEGSDCGARHTRTGGGTSGAAP